MNSRRRFQFSLRTMLVLVTLVCVGFGWWVHRSKEWIRQRHEWLSKTYSLLSHTNGGDPNWAPLQSRYALLARQVRTPPVNSPAAPCGLWLFGEVGVATVIVVPGDEQEAKRLFPEATISLYLPIPIFDSSQLIKPLEE